MLVQFKLKNFMSFKEETVLDMRAVNAYKEHESNLINLGKDKLLRVVSIYGANASGKSNLFKALRSFVTLVLESGNTIDKLKKPSIELHYHPFAFQKKNIESGCNTEFEVVMIKNEFEYRYGFEYNDKEIVSEWLYETPLNKRRVQSTIFERSREKIAFGKKVLKESAPFKDQISHNVLLLSFFGRLKLETESYRNIFFLIFGMHSFREEEHCSKGAIEIMLHEILNSDEKKKKFIRFLNSIDSGIKDVRVKDVDGEDYFITIHRGKDKKEYELSMFSESEGTLKSVSIYILSVLTMEMNSILWFDELNSKLHPLLVKFIVDLFYEKNTMSQLIYTSHDPTLMDRKFFRRDQIVFVDKDEYGQSELIALSDYKVRSDASFSKDYLAGMYGGIPNLTEFQMREGE